MDVYCSCVKILRFSLPRSGALRQKPLQNRWEGHGWLSRINMVHLRSTCKYAYIIKQLGDMAPCSCRSSLAVPQHNDERPTRQSCPHAAQRRSQRLFRQVPASHTREYDISGFGCRWFRVSNERSFRLLGFWAICARTLQNQTRIAARSSSSPYKTGWCLIGNERMRYLHNPFKGYIWFRVPCRYPPPPPPQSPPQPPTPPPHPPPNPKP